jgi:hypothetical protein
MHTGDEPYCTDEFALMATGWLMAQYWGDLVSATLAM